MYTTTLYYEGSLLATLSCDTSTWKTTFHDYGSGDSWTSTSPIGLVPGATWTLSSNASGTASTDGSKASGICGTGSGYFLYGVDSTTNNYYSEHYHPAFFTSAYRIDTTIPYGGSGGSGCHTNVCPRYPTKSSILASPIRSPEISFSCVEAIAGAGFGALGMVAAGAALLSGALTPIAVVGFIGAHAGFLWSITEIYIHCL